MPYLSPQTLTQDEQRAVLFPRRARSRSTPRATPLGRALHRSVAGSLASDVGG
jgi:hypothetical protein